MAGRRRSVIGGSAVGITGVTAAVMLALAGGALGGAAPVLAEPTGPVDNVDNVDNVGVPVTAPAAPCPPGPVGPPGVTDVPSAFGALMNLWQQARPPVVG